MIPVKGGVKPILLIGPYVAKKLSDSDGFEYGLVMGGGINFIPGFLSLGKFTFDFRYTLSFKKGSYRPLRQPPCPYGYICWWSSDFYYKTKVMLLMVGYYF